jgi:hypothetical protein
MGLMRISLEVRAPLPTGELAEVDMYLDREGLTSLLSQLTLLSTDKTDHLHLMTPSWGGDHLSEERHRADSQLVHHLEVQLFD